ncbi:MAG: sigma-70 family RNA polymerase sigma factor [Planctomycetes bacterium]|nr:sigma-70 family RNA polymerase sigma factor [Planctomycetota bacterium]
MAGLKEISLEFLQKRTSLQTYLHSLLGDSHLVEDMLQETWMRLADAIEKEKTIEDTAAWCRGTARNLVLHHWRKVKNEKVLVDSEVLDLMDQAFTENPDVDQHALDRRDALLKCLQNQPEHSQRILQLKYEEKKSFAQIAQVLNRPTATLMVTASSLRRALAICIERRMQVEGVS